VEIALGELVRAARGSSAQDPEQRVGNAHRPAARDLDVATRDEVDAYERRLRRKWFGALLAALFVVSALSSVAVGAAFGGPSFEGEEVEPNNTAAEATKIPLGRTARAHLGPRIDREHGDRDFYAFEVTEREPVVALRVSALPNIAMCTLLYRRGLAEAIGQYCVGAPGRDLAIDALSLAPGGYYLGVLQDMDPYGGTRPFVQENVSDAYEVSIDAKASRSQLGFEIEPNDAVASATEIATDASCTATIGWAHDEDVFCANEATGPIRWALHAEPSEEGVLEVTPLRGEEARAPVRLRVGARGVATSDGAGVWLGPPMSADRSRRCLRVRLAAEPGAARSGVRYTLKVVDAR
jgi:hypothetical protein